MNSASRSRLERFSDKLRDLLRRDAHHLKYKTSIYGECCKASTFCVGVTLVGSNMLVGSIYSVRLYAAVLTQKCCAGALLRWDEGEVNEALAAQGAAQRRSLGGATGKSVDRQDALRGRDGRLESSGEEEADDIFESEFVLLKDLWNFNNVPFPVTKQVRVTLFSSMRINARICSIDICSKA